MITINVRNILALALLLCLIITTSCKKEEINSEDDVLTFCFGSCNKHDLPQPLWRPVINENPDVWIWLGDNIYADTEDPDVMKEKYDLQRQIPDYKELMSKVKIIATWDDHDYGANDSNKNYPMKVESERLFWDFIDEPADSPRRLQKGVYNGNVFQVGDIVVKVILIDNRYFQDPVYDINGRYQPDPKADILGEEQWAWLENELNTSTASINIIGSGIQIINDDQPNEKWANFPTARQRLFDLIESSQVKNVIFITGDIHMAEVSKSNIEGYDQPIYEVTSSGMTHTRGTENNWYNSHSVCGPYDYFNYALMRITNSEKLKINLEIKGEKGIVFWSKEIQLVK